MYKPSGVVRSTNQYAPPLLKDGTFSAMFEIWGKLCHDILNVKIEYKRRLICSVFTDRGLAYSKEKADEDRTLNKDPLQWSKWTHTMSAICKSKRTKFSREIDSHEDNYTV